MLVSIIIITYNNSKYILDCLESVKTQTYKNIELIISDDCSTDDTVNICKDWINKNINIFNRIEFIKNDINSGISETCNRALKIAKGDWIKFLAGDDIFLDNCIEDLVNFVKKNNKVKIVFGNVIILKNGNLSIPKISKVLSADYTKQKRLIYKIPNFYSPGYFIKNDYLRKLGGFDKNYPFIEDWPLWIKIVENGEKLYTLDKPVVIYRKHSESMTSRGKEFIKLNYYRDFKKFFKNKILRQLIKNKLYLSLIKIINFILVTELIIRLGNRNNYLSKILYNLLYAENIFILLKSVLNFLHKKFQFIEHIFLKNNALNLNDRV